MKFVNYSRHSYSNLPAIRIPRQSYSGLLTRRYVFPIPDFLSRYLRCTSAILESAGPTSFSVIISTLSLDHLEITSSVESCAQSQHIKIMLGIVVT